MTEANSETPALRVAPEGAHPLPDGGWVVFRDPATIKQRDRKALTRRLDEARNNGDAVGDYSLGLSTVDATLALAITEWSIDLPVPAQSLDSLDELDIPVYNALTDLAEPFRDALFPGAKMDEAAAINDPEHVTPTGPSSA